MLSAPGQEFLFGRLGPGRHDNEGGGYLLFAGYWHWRDACVGDRGMAEKNPCYVARVHHLPVGDEAVGDRADDPDVPVLAGARSPWPTWAGVAAETLGSLIDACRCEASGSSSPSS